jgi:hypothetical protein
MCVEDKDTVAAPNSTRHEVEEGVETAPHTSILNLNLKLR